MGFLRDRRTLLLLGGALGAVLIGVLAAVFLRSGPVGTAPPPASRGGLVVETGRNDDTAVDPSRQIRCFVAGQFVGEMPLVDCARRNGVATGALDVGIDPSGALAGSRGASPQFTPLPPAQAQEEAAPVVAAPAAPNAPQTRACWAYAGGSWRRQPTDRALNDCVQALFAGRCEPQGGATYGRWGTQTLRLVPGKVEVSDDNRTFRTLVDQQEGCQIPPVG